MGGKNSSTSQASKRVHVFAPRGVQLVAHPFTNLKPHPSQTAHFRISLDSGLGTLGNKVADALLQTCEQDFTTLQGYFGGLTPASMPFEVIVTAGNQGASHATCAATALSIGAHSGPLGFMRSLVIAEEDEVFQASFGHGWNCGFSNGEGLSRGRHKLGEDKIISDMGARNEWHMEVGEIVGSHGPGKGKEDRRAPIFTSPRRTDRHTLRQFDLFTRYLSSTSRFQKMIALPACSSQH